jgi:recombination protein RecT
LGDTRNRQAVYGSQGRRETLLAHAGKGESVSTEITPAQQKMQTLRDALDKAKPSLATVLPHHLTPERMVKLALVAASRNPVLLQCDTKTVLQSVMQAAQLGLDCSGALGSAYLVPYRDNKRGTFVCQLIPGYRGLIDLARRSGQIASIEAHVVHEQDEFEVAFGLNPVLTHKPNLRSDPGPVVLAYAVAVLRDGTKQVEVMTRAQLDGIRKRSHAGQSGPWVTDEEEMQRKTVVRRLCKYLPLSAEMAQALTNEEMVEGDAPIIDVVAEIEAAEPEPAENKTDEVAAKLRGRRQKQEEQPAEPSLAEAEAIHKKLEAEG